MFVMITSEEYKDLIIKANKYEESQKPKLASVDKNNTENVIVGKIEGEDAKRFINFIEKELKNKEEN